MCFSSPAPLGLSVQALLGRIRAYLTKLLLLQFTGPFRAIFAAFLFAGFNDEARIISDYRTTSPATTLSFLKPRLLEVLHHSRRLQAQNFLSAHHHGLRTGSYSFAASESIQQLMPEIFQAATSFSWSFSGEK